ncbi:hypothetical protein ACJA88_002422 [Fusarium oxysporum]
MAELATIALVGNILQFLEVGIKLAATARRAYKSIDGCIKEDKDLLTDTGRLHSLISSIQTNRSLTQGNGQAAVDDSLIQAARACDEYASELTTLLETMSIRPGVTRTLESLRCAGNSDSWLDSRIFTSFAGDASLFAIPLGPTISSNQSSVTTAINKLRAQSVALEANTTTKLESLKSLILKVKPNDKDSTVQMIGHLENLLPEAQRVKRQHSLLKSLLFHTIKQRHNAIPERHQDTFKWVFERDTHQFCEWLESESGFFWVKGKAGSGKSTLMKYLAAHSQTKSLLQVWGKGQRVVTASHFFWNAGTSMQKSISGLFQTILYQVIKTCPQLIDIIGNCRKDLSDSAINDLEEYFKYMLQTIEDVYWESTTRIFRTVIAAEQSLPLLGFSFLDQEMGDPGYAVAMQ